MDEERLQELEAKLAELARAIPELISAVRSATKYAEELRDRLTARDMDVIRLSKEIHDLKKAAERCP